MCVEERVMKFSVRERELCTMYEHLCMRYMQGPVSIKVGTLCTFRLSHYTSYVHIVCNYLLYVRVNAYLH